MKNIRIRSPVTIAKNFNTDFDANSTVIYSKLNLDQERVAFFLVFLEPKGASV